MQFQMFQSLKASLQPLPAKRCKVQSLMGISLKQLRMKLSEGVRGDLIMACLGEISLILLR